MSTTTPERICYHCKRDCRGRKHGTDRRGRFVCWDCYCELKAAKEQRTREEEVAGVPADVPQLLAENPTKPRNWETRPVTTAPDDAPIDIAPLDDSGACVACSSPMPAGVRRCAICGHARGNPPPRPLPGGGKEHAAQKCRHCGYSLEGIAYGESPRCPECGKLVPMGRTALDEAVSRDVVRRAYLKPTLMFLIGSPIGIACYTGMGFNSAGLSGGGVGLVIALVTLAVFFVVTLITYIIYMLMFGGGIDAPFRLFSLQIAGAVGVALPINWLLYLVPMGFGSSMISVAIFGLILTDALDVETFDGFMISLVSAWIIFGALIALSAMI